MLSVSHCNLPESSFFEENEWLAATTWNAWKTSAWITWLSMLRVSCNGLFESCKLPLTDTIDGWLGMLSIAVTFFLLFSCCFNLSVPFCFVKIIVWQALQCDLKTSSLTGPNYSLSFSQEGRYLVNLLTLFSLSLFYSERLEDRLNWKHDYLNSYHHCLNIVLNLWSGLFTTNTVFDCTDNHSRTCLETRFRWYRHRVLKQPE